MTYDVHIMHLRLGRRGPMSSLVIRRSDGVFSHGHLFWEEVFPGQGISNVIAAEQWAKANAELLWDLLADPDEESVVAGFTRFGETENLMFERALRKAGWE